VKYAFVSQYKAVWPVVVTCAVLGVSVSGWRRHVRNERQGGQCRTASDTALLVNIRAIHQQTRGAYGSPRIWRQLRAQGIPVGKERVERLMREHGVVARGKRKFRATTDSKHKMPVAPNLLDRQFLPERPNKRWAGDITYIPTREGWLYLAVVLDLYSRSIIGWSFSERITRQLTVDAMSMAWFARGGKAVRGQDALLFHSDRGSQYASHDFQRLLTEYEITGSMSRKGNCWDNAVIESVFGSLKVERLHGQDFATRQEGKDEALAWIRFYNRDRMHSTLGYVSPMTFEEAWHARTSENLRQAA
jgi:putative transposase